jgi:hypothetical protein
VHRRNRSKDHLGIGKGHAANEMGAAVDLGLGVHIASLLQGFPNRRHRIMGARLMYTPRQAVPPPHAPLIPFRHRAVVKPRWFRRSASRHAAALFAHRERGGTVSSTSLDNFM